MSLKLSELPRERRDGILNAALKEFSLKGFDEASTNAIAKEAGLSKSLMFHYVGSKQALFIYVYDFFFGLLLSDYYEKLNYEEPDIFKRLRQSYRLQLDLLKKYPWILTFSKVSVDTRSSELNQAIQEKAYQQSIACYPSLFESSDDTRFKKDLDLETCKQTIYWSNVGFSQHLLEEIRQTDDGKVDFDKIAALLNEHLAGLEKLFYR